METLPQAEAPQAMSFGRDTRSGKPSVTSQRPPLCLDILKIVSLNKHIKEVKLQNLIQTFAEGKQTQILYTSIKSS